MISETQKVDWLWKKLGYGVTKTDVVTIKTATNESIPSALLLRGDKIWSQSDLVPNVRPTQSTSVVVNYDDTGLSELTVHCSKDLTASTNRTWKTNLTDWVPPEFGSTYQLKVYAAPASSTAPQTDGTQLFAAGSGNDDEWFFDYQSGVLHFIGTNLPSGVAGNDIFVSGSRYTGSFGVGSAGSGDAILWVATSDYVTDDIVVYGGDLYRARGNIASNGSNQHPGIDTAKWVRSDFHSIAISSSINVRDDDTTLAYTTDELLIANYVADKSPSESRFIINTYLESLFYYDHRYGSVSKIIDFFNGLTIQYLGSTYKQWNSSVTPPKWDPISATTTSYSSINETRVITSIDREHDYAVEFGANIIPAPIRQVFHNGLLLQSSQYTVLDPATGNIQFSGLMKRNDTVSLVAIPTDITPNYTLEQLIFDFVSNVSANSYVINLNRNISNYTQRVYHNGLLLQQSRGDFTVADPIAGNITINSYVTEDDTFTVWLTANILTFVA